MRVLIGAALAVLVSSGLVSSGAHAAAPGADVMAPINQFADGLDKGDMKMAAAPYAAESSIIDEFPPHLWMGANAFQAWLTDFGADAKAHGSSDPKLTLGKPTRLDVNGDHAYVVLPAVFSYKDHGRPMAEQAQMTFALQGVPGAWKISGWAFGGGKAHAVAAKAAKKK